MEGQQAGQGGCWHADGELPLRSCGTINSFSLGVSGYPQSLAFSKTTNTLAQKKRWENIRCRVFLGLAVAGGLLIILIVLLVTFLPTSDGESSQP